MRRPRRSGRGPRGVRRRRRPFAPAGLLLPALVAVTAFLLLRLAYPWPYRDLVVESARRHDLDPRLVAAVVRVESRFDPRAESRKGALGLMQIMPETGAWVAGRIGLTEFEPEDLLDPATNLRIGTWYLQDLLRTFDGDLVLALAAYNGGRGNVRRWIEGRDLGGGVESRLAHIAYPETRRFVRRVLHGYRMYRLLYPWY